jgi:hypothetical protein
MKTLTLELKESVLERAERRAARQGVTLEEKLAELVRDYADEATPDPAALLAALDHARNTSPIGPLGREQLHDRDLVR